MINHGMSPASVHGAITKKTAEPRTAVVRCAAASDPCRCELMPTFPSWCRRHPGRFVSLAVAVRYRPEADVSEPGEIFD